MINQNETMAVLMEQLKAKNPSKFELLNQLMQQQNTNQVQVEEKPNAKVQGQISRLIKINSNLKMNSAKLKRQKNILIKHLDFFIALNNEFSKAVGACPCWGLDDTCACQHSTSTISNQQGGGPGTFDVDMEMFNVYVLPSLKEELLANLVTKRPRQMKHEA